jgi:hypothetical protein
MGNTQTQNAEIQKLLSQGVTMDFINAHPELRKGKWIDPQDTPKFLNLWNQQPKILPPLEGVPDFLANDPAFKALPRDMQEIAVYNYNIQKANDADKAQKLGIALEQATRMADPYWRNIIMIAQDEVLRGFEQADGDYDSSVQRQQRIVQNINEDLTKNRNFLSLEQQSDLTNISRNYEIAHDQLLDSAAGAGLTFSTKRKIAEKRLSEENQGLVESTSRRYNQQITGLETEAQRGNVEAQKEIEDLQRRIGESKTSMGRSAETYLGSAGLPQLEGYSALGNVPGQIYEDKTRDIAVRQDALYNELTKSSLNI